MATTAIAVILSLSILVLSIAALIRACTLFAQIEKLRGKNSRK